MVIYFCYLFCFCWFYMINYLLDGIFIGRDNWCYMMVVIMMIVINIILILLLMDKYDNKVYVVFIYYCSL